MDMAASTQGPFRLRTEALGALPVVDHFLGRLGLSRLLDDYLPARDGRLRLAPAKAIGIVVRNLALSHQPLYSLNEWAAGHDPAVLGLEEDEVRLVNDDRVGRALERLFDADRSSLLGRLVLDAVAEFGVDCSEMHNDSTSIRLSGAYSSAVGAARGGKPTPAAARGHSKDHRPDLKQLVWILTVSADGAVPVVHRFESGNVEDSSTHIATWMACAGSSAGATSAMPPIASSPPGRTWSTSTPWAGASSLSCRPRVKRTGHSGATS